MRRWMSPIGVLTSLMLLGLVTGCEDKTATAELPPPQPADDAAERIAELQRQLAEANAARQADQSRIDALQRELERLRNQPPTIIQQPAPPPPSEGWTNIPGGAMIALEGRVLFDSGKAVIKPSGLSVLRKIAETIQTKYPDYEIFIYGHTDNEPIRYSGWKDNYELSAQRALSVLRYFRSLGLTQPIGACGWGEDRPIASNATAASRQLNRRVEVYAMIPTGGNPPPNAGRAPQ